MSKAVSWDDQRIFLAVLEEGSLSAAARRLGMAQPTVRNRLFALEKVLDTVLFTRSVNGVVPTKQAQALAVPARAMARASDVFIRNAAASAGEVAGVVRLSVAEFVGVEVLPSMLSRLRKKHPDIIIELALSNTAADLLAQEVDLAVRMTRPRHQSLVAKKVGVTPLGFFAHESYIEQRGMPMCLEDLADHDIIGPDRARFDLAIITKLFADIDRKNFILRTDNHPAQLAAARAGLGVVAVQSPIGHADERLCAILPDLVVAELDTWIVAHEDLRSTPRVSAVFDHLVEEYTAFNAAAASPRLQR